MLTAEEHDHVQMLEGKVKRYRSRIAALKEQYAALDALIASPLYQQFRQQQFWHAHHVDLVWRMDGHDVREQADWLKTIWQYLKPTGED